MPKQYVMVRAIFACTECTMRAEEYAKLYPIPDGPNEEQRFAIAYGNHRCSCGHRMKIEVRNDSTPGTPFF